MPAAPGPPRPSRAIARRPNFFIILGGHKPISFNPNHSFNPNLVLTYARADNFILGF